MRRCLLLFGATLAVGLLLLLRETFALFGGDEIVVMLGLALLLAATAAGARFGRRRADSVGAGALVAALAGVGSILPLCLLMMRMLAPVVRGDGLSISIINLIALAALMPFGFAAGIFLAVAAGLVRRILESPQSALRMVLSWTAAGASLGALFFTLIMSHALCPLSIAAMMAMLNCLAGFAVWWHDRLRIGRAGWALLPAAAFWTAALFANASVVLDFYTLAGRYPHAVLRDAVAGPTGLAEAAEENGERQLRLNGRAVALDDSAAERLAVAAALCRTRPPARALVISAVPDGAMRLVEMPWPQVTLVSPDPALLALNDDAPRHDRVRVIAGSEARTWLGRSSAKYDLILIALPGAAPECARFRTRQFMRLARRSLTGDGVLAMSLDGGDAASVGAWQAARKSYAQVRAIPADGRIILLASPAADAGFPHFELWQRRGQAWGVNPAWLGGDGLRQMAAGARSAPNRPGAAASDWFPANGRRGLESWLAAACIPASARKVLLGRSAMELLLLLAAASGGLCLWLALTNRRGGTASLSVGAIAAAAAGLASCHASAIQAQTGSGWLLGGLVICALAGGVAVGAAAIKVWEKRVEAAGLLALMLVAAAVVCAAATLAMEMFGLGGDWAGTIGFLIAALATDALAGMALGAAIMVGSLARNAEATSLAGAFGWAAAGALLAGVWLPAILGFSAASLGLTALCVACLLPLLISDRRLAGSGESAPQNPGPPRAS